MSHYYLNYAPSRPCKEDLKYSKLSLEKFGYKTASINNCLFLAYKSTKSYKNYYFSYKNFFIFVNFSKLFFKSDEITLSNIHEYIPKIVCSYKEEFELFPSLLNGRFSFFIIDRASQELNAFNDKMSVGQIFYSEINQIYSFSSNISHILSKKDFTKIPNKRTITKFANQKLTNSEETFYQGIKKLPPRDLLLISDQRLFTRPYKKIAIYKDIKKLDLNKTAQNFKKVFFESISKETKNKKKVGLMFSGGLDSASILSVLKDLKSNDVSTYTARFNYLPKIDLEKISENNFQDEYFKDKTFKHNIYEATKTTLSRIDFYLDTFRQPFIYPNLNILEESIKLAKKDNVDVLLTGMDGDSVISYGYENLVNLFITLRWFKLITNLKDIAKTHKVKIRIIFFNLIVKPVFKSIKESAFNIFRKNQEKNTQNFLNVIRPNIFHRMMMEDLLRYESIEKLITLAKEYDLDLAYPFYDENLIEYCISVNPNFKLHNGYTRYILRYSLKDILKDGARKRIAKSNMGISFFYQLRNFDKNFVNKSLKDPNKMILEFIDIEQIRSEWDYFKESKNFNRKLERIALRIFSFLVLNRWLEREFKTK